MRAFFASVVGCALLEAPSPAQPPPFPLEETTVDEIRSALTSRRISCRALVQLYLRRIEAFDKAGPALNAVQTVNPRALQEADRLDAALAASGATFDYPPIPVPADALTRTQIDCTGPGNNRRLSPVIDFPAISVPAGFTADGLPLGLELMARPFAEATLFRLAYAYEQGTRHRRPSALTPSLAVR